MKERVIYTPEIGDSVILLDGRVGVIYSFGRHCSHCERFANVGANATIIACPNIVDLQWNQEKVAWVVQGDTPEENEDED